MFLIVTPAFVMLRKASIFLDVSFCKVVPFWQIEK